MRFSRTLLVFVLTLSITIGATLQAQEGTGGVVLFGQPDFTSSAPGHSATGLNFPLGIAVDSTGGFYVADRDNHRILYFALDGDTVADQVYGQHGNFESYISNYDGSAGSGKPSADNLSMPTVVNLAPDGGIYITDRENHRVLYYAPGDTTADLIYGQFGNYSINPPNNNGRGGSGLPGSETIGVFTLGVVADTSGLYVSDSSNNRVLFFAADGNTAADRVYGQFGAFTVGVINNNGSGVTGQVSADSLNFPRGLALDSLGGLYVADRENHRVLYFAPDGDTTADRVYGQFGDFTTALDNRDSAGATGVVSADSLSFPKGVALALDGGLYIADSLNSRILYYAPDGDTTADWVYGQGGSFTGNAAATTADGLNQPQGIAVGPDGRLYIADTGNNRVLIVAGHSG